MVMAGYFDKNGVKKGAWSEEEDQKLRAYILRYGTWNWRLLPKYAGLQRCGKSCRLRWVNYLKPGVKRGNYTKEEEDLIDTLHDELGNKWSAIAARLPGRTDNDIKNYWHWHLEKRGKRSRSRSGRQRAEKLKDQRQSDPTSFKKAVSGGDDTAAAQTPRCRRHEKVSSDVYILESSCSSSNDISGAANCDLDSSAVPNCSEMLSGSSNINCSAFNSVLVNCSDGGSSWDLFSGFQENFWTEPFVVDTSHGQSSSFSTLDDCWPFFY